MSTINEKLLLECIDAILAGDMKTAERKFNNNWDRTSQKIIEALDMEDAEDDIEIADTVEDVMNDESDAEEDCFDDILAAVSELETKFPTEMTDEIQAHFDELKNKVDDLRLGSDEEDEDACDAALMALDDLKGDFDLAGGLEDDVIDIFNEIGEKLSSCCEESEEEDDDDDDGEEVEETEEEKEIVSEAKDAKLSEEGEVEVDVEKGEQELGEPAEPEAEIEDKEDKGEGTIEDADDRTAEETILDAQAHTKELEAEMDALLAKAKDGELEESFKAMKGDSMKKEKAGVSKEGLAMPRPTRIDTDAKMGTSSANTKGKALPKTVGKRIEVNQEQVSKWKPIPKHNPKAAASKSVIG